METASLEAIRALPKVELHAHLSGSVSQRFLLDLMRRKGLEISEADALIEHEAMLQCSISECFRYFDRIRSVMDSLEVLRECTEHVLEAFAADRCVYLELRTTLKEFAKEGEGDGAARKTSKEEYLLTVLGAIRDFRVAQAARGDAVPMEVRMLLSVDRGTIRSLEDARLQVQEVAALCERYPEDVVGIDLCGNPQNLSLEPFVLPALLELHSARPGFFMQFPITCHMAETPMQESETDAVLQNLECLNIRRLGHVLFLTEAQRQRLLDAWGGDARRRPGVELCPTSNLVCKQEPDRRKHDFPRWFNVFGAKQEAAGCGNGAAGAVRGSVLVSVNTDDTGLFATSLSEELHLLAEAFGLTLEDVRELQRQAAASSFCRSREALLALLPEA